MPVRAGWDASWDGYTHLGVIEDDDASQAIIYAADQGADVISMSWGNLGEYSIVRDAINYANDSGVFLVAAAGNSPPPPVPFVLYPAAFEQVISVTATDSNDHFISGWNYGSWIDVSAPGYNIYTTEIGDTYGYASGTSLATPHVAGAAALIKAKYPSWTKKALISRLINRTDYIDGLNPSYDQKMGRGRLNAASALGSDYTHPDGTLVKTANDVHTYYIAGHKRWIPNWSLFIDQFDFSRVVIISDGEMASYTEGTKFRYRDGSLILAANAIYIVEHSALRHIVNWSTFVGLGYNLSMVHSISDSDMNQYYTIGDPFISTSYHATGSLVQTASVLGIYRLEDGQRRHVKNWDIFLKNGFNYNEVVTISDAEMADYPSGDDVVYPDGMLIKGSDLPIYVVENGMKRHIASWAKFVSLGYSLSNVIMINDTDLNNDYPTDSPIS